jgi:hypothetical protein
VKKNRRAIARAGETVSLSEGRDVQRLAIERERGDRLITGADAHCGGRLVNLNRHVASAQDQGAASIFKLRNNGIVCDPWKRQIAARKAERRAADPLDFSNSIVKPERKLSTLPIARNDSSLCRRKRDQEDRGVRTPACRVDTYVDARQMVSISPQHDSY